MSDTGVNMSGKDVALLNNWIESLPCYIVYSMEFSQAVTFGVFEIVVPLITPSIKSIMPVTVLNWSTYGLSNLCCFLEELLFLKSMF